MHVQFLGSGKAIPAPIVARQPAPGVIVLEPSPLEEIVQVSEPPGDQSEARHAEEAVEDLTGNLNPDFASTVVVVAGRVAHGWRSLE